MKKLILKPGFEAIFALSLIVILGLPPVLLAQNEKEIDIKIVNGDTTVNGKKIKELSKEERRYALRDIKHLSRRDSVKIEGVNRIYLHKRRDTLNGEAMSPTDVQRDMERLIKEKERQLAYEKQNYEMRPDGMMRSEWMNRKNIQRFDYENIDNNGIATHVRFRVSEISNDDLKRMPHVEGGRFEIENLNIVPEFNSGSTLLMFSLPQKNEAQVKLIDSQGKILWDEKVAGGRFTKTFTLGLNGIYFLQIKQGNFFAVRRIVKEE